MRRCDAGITRWALSLLLGALSVGCHQRPSPPPPGPPMNVLFIGNSLTYTNDLPGLLTAMAKAEGQALRATMQAPGGWTLAQHDADPASNALIAQGGWDYVVLQEQSSTSVDFPATFIAGATALDAKVKAAGAKTLLYQNWPLKGQPQRAQDYHRAFGELAAQLDAGWARAGDAWELVRLKDASRWAALYGDDRHPSPLGTYLTACSLYIALTGRAPTQASPRADVSAADSADCQAVAWTAAQAPADLP